MGMKIMRDEQGKSFQNQGGMAYKMRCYHASGWLFFVNGYKERLYDGFHLIGKYLSFIMILWVWNILWGMVPDDVMNNGQYNHANLVWYIAVTEAIIFCGGHLFYDAYLDIKSGKIEQLLMRPVSYQFRAMAEWYGRALGQLTLFFPLAMVSAFFITGEFAVTAVQIIAALAMSIAALFCVVCFNYMVAMTTLWIKEASPAYWITQKLCFLFGGLLFPLSLYPEAFYKVTQFLPFAAVFFFPGSTMLNDQPYGFVQLLLFETFWMIVLCAFAVLVHKIAVKRIAIKGV